MPAPSRPSFSATRAIIVDLVLVVVFVVIGRLSHDEGASVLGIAETGWPFIVALGLGWLLVGFLASGFWAPMRVWPTGVLLWAVTVAGGLGLRVLFGDSAELPFVIVATLTLALFLIGWRAIAALIRRLRKPSSDQDPAHLAESAPEE